MSNLLAKALEVVEGEIKTAPEKIPQGMTVIGLELSRDQSRSGKFITAIDRNWLATGRAVAVKDGHVVRANYVFGRFSENTPKVTACHYVVCPTCGKRCLQPLAVWEAKDAARKNGVEVKDDMPGMAVLDAYGHCPCGGKWALDKEAEKAELTEFTNKVLKAVEATPGPMPKFVEPKAFLVMPEGTNVKPLDPDWAWLTDALAKQHKTVSGYDKALKGDPVLFNPGFWIGYAADPDSTSLFWVEDGNRKPRREQRQAFNPFAIEGL